MRACAWRKGTGRGSQGGHTRWGENRQGHQVWFPIRSKINHENHKLVGLNRSGGPGASHAW
jgi:hypothetical protein